MDLENMLDISEAVTRAALARTESRGGHTREDFPESDGKWGKQNLIVRREKGEITATPRALAEMPAELQTLFAK
jgi:succinate dehydrogenase / fumarate reductase flavoprotein subunit